MRTRILSTEQIQRTIDVFNHDRTLPMIIIGSAAIQLHMHDRMKVLTVNPNVDVLSSLEAIDALAARTTAEGIDAIRKMRGEQAGGHSFLKLRPSEAWVQRGVLPMNVYTGFGDGQYDISFEDARATARFDIQTGLPKLPLADVIDWKLSLENWTVDDRPQIQDALDVATIDGDLTPEQIAQFNERLRQKSHRVRFTRDIAPEDYSDVRWAL